MKKRLLEIKEVISQLDHGDLLAVEQMIEREIGYSEQEISFLLHLEGKC